MNVHELHAIIAHETTALACRTYATQHSSQQEITDAGVKYL